MIGTFRKRRAEYSGWMSPVNTEANKAEYQKMKIPLSKIVLLADKIEKAKTCEKK